MKFYQAVLKPITVIELNKITKGIPILERIDANCPECGKDEWWLLPKDSAPVRMGMKPYCECLNCGYQTHL